MYKPKSGTSPSNQDSQQNFSNMGFGLQRFKFEMPLYLTNPSDPYGQHIEWLERAFDVHLSHAVLSNPTADVRGMGTHYSINKKLNIGIYGHQAIGFIGLHESTIGSWRTPADFQFKILTDIRVQSGLLPSQIVGGLEGKLNRYILENPNYTTRMINFQFDNQATVNQQKNVVSVATLFRDKKRDAVTNKAEKASVVYWEDDGLPTTSQDGYIQRIQKAVNSMLDERENSGKRVKCFAGAHFHTSTGSIRPGFIGAFILEDKHDFRKVSKFTELRAFGQVGTLNIEEGLSTFKREIQKWLDSNVDADIVDMSLDISFNRDIAQSHSLQMKLDIVTEIGSGRKSHSDRKADLLVSCASGAGNVVLFEEQHLRFGQTYEGWASNNPARETFLEKSIYLDHLDGQPGKFLFTLLLHGPKV